MKIWLEVPGKPVAKKRPRFVKKTGLVFDPNATEEGRVMIYLLSFVRINNFEPLTGPLEAGFEFVFTRPKGHYGTGRNSGKLKKSAPKYCMNQMDFDNLEKFICDAMNGIIYQDDRQIVKTTGTEKRWGDTAKTIIKIRELEGPKDH